ncbi:MAG: NADH-quinone oxidoreductase subunit NuoN [Pseudomonadales bacterium]|jgi:NADH-quinone oxidoreductase subunit N|nr:NADH-quinone oxidoreductase subunit NuoN [Pseudomonadales bacterium]MCP5320182.1 NADH-quinone oxidoreductase subunit NuoN [Pseudomonadales bacterium]MCP5337729.1 NADH-quinone oxidoreductase subunit NuoN [Pseudomonadales bacterium]
MTIGSTELLALAPLLVTVTTAVAVMLSIAWRRNHFLSATLTVVGLNVALLVTLLTRYSLPLEMPITALMQHDGLSLFGTATVLISTLGCATLAHAYLEGLQDNRDELYLMLLIATCGAIVLVGANHMATFLIGLELISLPLYGLIGYIYRDRRSLEAAIKYLVLSAAASTLLLFGMALIYAQTGTLAFTALAQSVHAGEPLLVTGLALMLAGIAFKLSLAPFHLWTPDVYHGAPAPIGAFLATVAKIAVILVLLRWWQRLGLGQMALPTALLGGLAVLSILAGNLLALFQGNVKRLLGYSSIAHFGYALIAIVAGSTIGDDALRVYLLTYMAAALGAFGALTLLSSPYRGDDAQGLADLRGLFWQRPYLAAVMTVAMLSLAGIPLTAGFVAKFYVAAAGVAGNLWGLVAALVTGSAIGIYFYLRVVVTMFLAVPGRRRLDAERNWSERSGGIMTVLLSLFTLAVGIYPQPLLDLLP